MQSFFRFGAALSARMTQAETTRRPFLSIDAAVRYKHGFTAITIAWVCETNFLLRVLNMSNSPIEIAFPKSYLQLIPGRDVKPGISLAG
jgi:hypothetical protein